MITLSLDRINAKSPYVVSESHGGLEFCTSLGIRYRIRFILENEIGGCETYQFAISKLDDVRSKHDPNVSAVTFIVIDEFFSENDDVLLYYCDSTDHREAGRNRLFIRWFEQAASPNRFTIKTANAMVEGQGLYVAIIVENRNPLLQSILSDFEMTSSLLSDGKPENRN